MSGKYRSKKEFERMTERFFDNCKEKGYPEELSKEVWRQMSSFAGYAFCKAHSASFAVESYQSLFLKTYYPMEFYTSVVNNFGGFYKSWVYLNEAKRHGAQINLPDMNKSRYTTCICDNQIFLGWIHIKDLETGIVEKIITERQREPFRDFDDFTQRIPVTSEQLMLLIRSRAFRFTGKSKKQLMWDQVMTAPAEPQPHLSQPLFKEKKKEFVLPPLQSRPLEEAYDEMELFGFPVSMSRFDMLQTQYRGNTKAKELLLKIGQTVRMVGDLVTIKYVHTTKKEWMHFGCFLDDKGDFFDTTHFPDSLKRYPFTGNGVYLIEGQAVEEFGFPSVEVQKLARLPYEPDPRWSNSKK
jgi:DNA polymerase-3 subunit alpha